MRYSSANLRAVLARGSFDTRWVVDIFYDGQRQMQDVQVIDVKHTEDGTAKVQQSGSLTIIYQDRFARSIAPKDVEDLLSPFGTTLALYMLVSTGPVFTERVPMGQYVITEVPIVDTVRWNHRGVARAKGDRIKVNFKDPFYKVLRNRFDVPGVTPSLTSTYGEIQRLTRLPVTRNPLVPDKVIPRALVYEEDRLDAVYELAGAVDATPYMMPDGTVSLRPNGWAAPVDVLAAADSGGEPVPLAPRGYTTWTEQSRNYMQDPRFTVPANWLATAGTYTVTSGVMDVTFTAAATSNALTPSPTGWWTAWTGTGTEFISASYLVQNIGAVTAIMRIAVWNNVAYTYGPTVTIAPGETAVVSASVPVPAGSAYAQPRLHFAPASPSGTRRLLISEPVADKTPAVPGFLDGDTNPGGGLWRTRWLGTPAASVSVLETRDIVPEVPGIRIPSRGTLVGVRRGMSADGVYNRVVVRAQGQQVGVLAAREIADGALRAANDGGADSPFGRVPYFYSSQLITTLAQAQAYVDTWLPRLSRPQAVVLDIVEMVNPLREVGDVLTVRRRGEEFPARVMRVDRGSGKTQSLKVTVVPSV